jgi:hypothetical protein
MTRSLRLICPLLSVGLLAIGFFLAGLTWITLVLFLSGILWTIGLSFHWTWVSPLGLLSAYLAAAVGLLLSLSSILMITGATFALLAWDLAGFHDRLSLASPDDDTVPMEQRHLVRILALALAGVGLSALALSLHLKSPFEWLVILVFFMVWAIGKVVGWILKKEA